MLPRQEGKWTQLYEDADATTPAQQMVRNLYDHALSDQTIADLCASTQGTINKIRHGRESGRNLERRLRRLCGIERSRL